MKIKLESRDLKRQPSGSKKPFGKEYEETAQCGNINIMNIKIIDIIMTTIIIMLNDEKTNLVAKDVKRQPSAATRPPTTAVSRVDLRLMIMIMIMIMIMTMIMEMTQVMTMAVMMIMMMQLDRPQLLSVELTCACSC